MGIKKTVEESVESLAGEVRQLAVEMRQGFKSVGERFEVMDDKIDNKIEGLAIAVQQGFSGITEEFRGEFKGVKERLDKIEFSSTSLDPRVSVLEQKIQIIGTKLGLQL